MIIGICLIVLLLCLIFIKTMKRDDDKVFRSLEKQCFLRREHKAEVDKMIIAEMNYNFN